MTSLDKNPDRRNSAVTPPLAGLRRIGEIPIGTGANLTVSVGRVDGAGVVEFRNYQRSAAGFLPASPRVIMGSDKIPALIATLQEANGIATAALIKALRTAARDGGRA